MNRKMTGKRSLAWLAALTICLSAFGVVLPAMTATAEETPIYLDTSYTFAERAADLVSRMTLDEKASQLGDSAGAIPRLGISAYRWWSEGLHGVARSGYATSFPTAYGIAQTWNRDLVQEMMTITSDEARAYNNQIGKGLSYWSPTINMSRDPRWGRAEETYGEDPYLTAQIGASFAKGLEGTDEDTKYLKAIATIKHYALNNTEQFRHSGSSDIDDATLREYYTRAYKDIVRETGIHSLMTAYNRVNGTPSAANTYLLETLLRRTFGFTGYVTSDCGAINDIYVNHKWVPEGWDHAVDEAEATALCLLAGNDLECGGVFRSHAKSAVQRGLLTEDDIDVNLVRLFTARMETGEWDPAEEVPYRDTEKYGWDTSYAAPGGDLAAGAPKLATTDYAAETALKSSEEAVALLKNEAPMGGNAPILPLDGKTINNLVIVGENELVNNLILGDYSGTPLPQNVSKPFDGIKKVLQSINPNATVTHVGSSASGDFYGNFANTMLKDANGNTLTTLTPNDVADTDTKVENGGANFGYVYNGSYAVFNNVSVDDVTQVTIMASGNTSHGTIEIHMDAKDGPIIGRVETAKTNDWNDYRPYTGTFDANAKGFTGTHTLYLVCNSGAEYQAFSDAQQATIRNADAVIAYVGTRQSDSGEENDRRSLNFPRFQSNMVQSVAALNPNTVVYVCSVAQMNVEEFKDDVPAIFWATYNGQAQGEAAGNLIFGNANPSGHLTFTWYSDMAELGAITDYTIASSETSNGRTYQYYTGRVSYPFGHGLSYSNFEYSNMRIEGLSSGEGYQMGDVNGNDSVSAEDALMALQAATKKIELTMDQTTRADVDNAAGVTANDALMILQAATKKITLPMVEGGDNTITPDDTLTVTVDVTNNSEVDGAEVVQAYVSSPKADKVNRPAKQLKGFEKVFIAAGETKTVSIDLPVADWYFWNEEEGRNVYDQGDWTVEIGASSGDIRATQTITMAGELTPAVAVVTAIPSGHTLNLSAKTLTTDLSVVMNDDSFCDLSDAEITYTSSNPAVATVDENGVVRSVAPGVATITVTATVNGTTGTSSFPVAVKDEFAISGITINGEPLQGFNSSTFNYTVRLDEDATAFVVGTPDEGPNVVVTQATSLPGTATIVATHGDTVLTYSVYLYRPHKAVSTDFTKVDELPSDWRVYSNGANVSENPANWALTANGLSITTEAGDIYQAHNNTKNIFVQDADGDWVVDTKVTMDKGFQGGYQQLGLLAFQDEDNYLKFSYESGNRIKVVQEVGGSTSEKQPQNGGMQSSGLVQYFRIQKNGDEYTFFNSVDGESFDLLTTTTCKLQNVKIALMAEDSFNPVNGPITATFEYVNVIAMEDCTCEIDTVVCEDQVLDLAAAMTGTTPVASVTVKGDCPIPSHQTPTATYTYALKAGGENTASAAIVNNKLQGVRQGYVDITVTAKLSNGSTGSTDTRITIQNVESVVVDRFVPDDEVTTSSDVHAMQINLTRIPDIDLTAYAGKKLYLEYDIKVDSTHTNPAPANEDWVKSIVNGYININDVQVDKLGYNRSPLPSFTKAGEWTTFKVELPATVTGLGTINKIQFLVYNDTGTNYAVSSDYVDNGIAWSNDHGATISVRNIKITTNG